MSNNAAHSPIGGSRAKQILKCPGSTSLRAAYIAKYGPIPSSKYAAEGTRLHSLMEHCLRAGDYSADEFIGGWLEGENANRSDAWGRVTVGFVEPFTAEQVGAVNVVLARVEDLMRLPGAVLYVETRFHLADIDPRAFGTADIVIVTDDAVYMIDAKFGVGTPVEVTGNEQLRYYGGGVRRSIPEAMERARWVLIVAQPRLSPPHPDGPVREWETDLVSEIEWESVLAAGIKAGDVPGAPCVPGDHCKFCPGTTIVETGAYYCAAYEASKKRVYDDAFAVIADPVSLTELTPEELGRRYSELAILAKYIKDFSTFVKREARKVEPAGFQWAPGSRDWTWNKPPADILTTARAFLGEETAAKISGVCTPLQAEKTLGVAFAEIAEFVDKKTSAPSLVKKGTRKTTMSLEDVRAFYMSHDDAFSEIE